MHQTLQQLGKESVCSQQGLFVCTPLMVRQPAPSGLQNDVKNNTTEESFEEECKEKRSLLRFKLGWGTYNSPSLNPEDRSPTGCFSGKAGVPPTVAFPPEEASLHANSSPCPLTEWKASTSTAMLMKEVLPSVGQRGGRHFTR